MNRGRRAKYLVLAVAATAFVFAWSLRGRPSSGVPAPVSSQASESSVPSTREAILTSTPAVPEKDRQKDVKMMRDLDEIFASRNDNDPRLDTEFRNLTPVEKELLRDKYRDLPRESLNERGTIVFLLGRELKTPEDYAFLAQVGNQQPCLSLGDCQKQASISEESIHEEDAVSVTLTYPQRVALKSLENVLSRAQHAGAAADPAQVNLALGTLGSITNSPVSWVGQKAAELQAQYSGLRH